MPTARLISEEIVLLEKEVTRPDIDYVVERLGDIDADNRAGIERTLHRISAIRNRRGDIIGLTCYSPFFHLNEDLGKALKDADSSTPIMVGGPHITIMREKAFLPQFDYAFVQEAEGSFVQFLDQYERGGDISEVKGVIYRKDGEVVSTGDSGSV